MGRTSPRKQRKIAELRNQGYTQEETARKVKTTVKTVRKYDPLRGAKPGAVPQEPPKAVPQEMITKELFNKMESEWGGPLYVGPSSSIEEQLAALSEWVDALILKVEEPLLCPNCFKGTIKYVEWKRPDGYWDGAYVCQECGYPMPSIERPERW